MKRVLLAAALGAFALAAPAQAQELAGPGDLVEVGYSTDNGVWAGVSVLNGSGGASAGYNATTGEACVNGFSWVPQCATVPPAAIDLPPLP